jgi:hypothetical protein
MASDLAYKSEATGRLMLWVVLRRAIHLPYRGPEKRHDKPKGPQHQEKTEVQELRGQGAPEEGRQGGQMPALRRHRGALTRLQCCHPPVSHIFFRLI